MAFSELDRPFDRFEHSIPGPLNQKALARAIDTFPIQPKRVRA